MNKCGHSSLEGNCANLDLSFNSKDVKRNYDDILILSSQLSCSSGVSLALRGGRR